MNRIASETPSRCSGETHGEAKVSVRRNGQKIEAIEVVCPCGNEIILECIQDELASAAGVQIDPAPDNA